MEQNVFESVVNNVRAMVSDYNMGFISECEVFVHFASLLVHAEHPSAEHIVTMAHNFRNGVCELGMCTINCTQPDTDKLLQMREYKDTLWAFVNMYA